MAYKAKKCLPSGPLRKIKLSRYCKHKGELRIFLQNPCLFSIPTSAILNFLDFPHDTFILLYVPKFTGLRPPFCEISWLWIRNPSNPRQQFFSTWHQQVHTGIHPAAGLAWQKKCGFTHLSGTLGTVIVHIVDFDSKTQLSVFPVWESGDLGSCVSCLVSSSVMLLCCVLIPGGRESRSSTMTFSQRFLPRNHP